MLPITELSQLSADAVEQFFIALGTLFLQLSATAQGTQCFLEFTVINQALQCGANVFELLSKRRLFLRKAALLLYALRNILA